MSKASENIRAIERYAQDRLIEMAWKNVLDMKEAVIHGEVAFDRLDDLHVHASEVYKGLVKYFFSQVYHVSKLQVEPDPNYQDLLEKTDRP